MLFVIAVIAIVISAWGLYLYMAGDYDKNLVPFSCGLASLVLVLVLLVVASVVERAKVQARLINEQFGTSYTASDMFWAGRTVEAIVELERRKIELKHIAE